jgi:atypical dual specificity phosphatase
MRQPDSGSALWLRGLGIAYGDRPVLESLDLDLPARGVTVLLGPSGTGKSTLLRTLAGEHASHPSMRLQGRIDYILPGERPPLVMQKARLLLSSVFENLVHEWPERGRLTGAQQQAHVQGWLASLGLARLAEQLNVPVVQLSLPDQRLVPVLRRAMAETPMLLVDEPTAGLSDAHAEPVLDLLRQLGRQRSVFVAMHHLGHSRAIADGVVLIASRRLQEHSPAAAFFAAPVSESGRLFLRTGSCPEERLPATDPDPVSPPDSPPPADAANSSRTLGPNGFAWLLPGQLGGTPWPGLVQPADYDLGLLRGVGVTRLLSVTDRPFPAQEAAAHGMAVDHERMRDMQAPGIAQALALCQRLDGWLASGEVVAVHCHAGLGRTGTTLGAYWIWRHGGRLGGSQALQQIRRHHAGWVQSQAQIDFLNAFAPAVARMKSGTPMPSDAASTAIAALHPAT